MMIDVRNSSFGKSKNETERQNSIIDVGGTHETELFGYFYRAKQRRKKYYGAPGDLDTLKQRNLLSFVGYKHRQRSAEEID